MGILVRVQAKFIGSTPSKKQGSSYCTLKFIAPEVSYGTVFHPNVPNLPILVDSFEPYKSLTPNTNYMLDLHPKYEAPNGNYAGKVKYEIVKFNPLPPGQSPQS